MKIFCNIIKLFLCSISISCTAQCVTITYPTSRTVFQRTNDNQARIFIAGNYCHFADKIEARAIARTMLKPQGLTTNWETIQYNPTNGFFFGSLIISGGWYDLEVRCWNGTNLLGISTLERVGIGEVFLVAGQSNSTGDAYLKAQGDYGSMANDDRVNAVNYTISYPTNFGAVVLPKADFTHLDSTVAISPFGTSAWCWGALGDTLVNKLNVPITFFNGGWSGTGAAAWNESASDSTATPFNYYIMPRGMPYGNLRAALHFYIAQYGIRAVLWHQGEADNQQETSRNSYGSFLKNIIAKSRLHSGKSRLAWVVSRASRYKGFQINKSRIWPPVIDAQNDVIGLNGTSQTNYIDQVYEGPKTDSIIGPNIRTPDSVHFLGNGHRILASVWSQKLNESFFANTTPYSATIAPVLTSNCNGVENIIVSAPNNFRYYQWSDNPTADNNLSNSISYTASSGAIQVRVKDALGNILISPQLAIPNNFSGLIPVTSSQSGYWHDASTWSCGRIPSYIDIVKINPGHNIIISNGLTARYKKIQIDGNLIFLNAAKLQN